MNKLIIRQTSKFVDQISHNQITAFFQMKAIRLCYFLQCGRSGTPRNNPDADLYLPCSIMSLTASLKEQNVENDQVQEPQHWTLVELMTVKTLNIL